MHDFEVKKVYKGAVLIPKEFREKLGLEDGQNVVVTLIDDCVVIEKLKIKQTEEEI